MSETFSSSASVFHRQRDARGADCPGDGLVTIAAEAETLARRIDASASGQLEGLTGALARHLDRFAFREAPLRFDWQDHKGK